MPAGFLLGLTNGRHLSLEGSRRESSECIIPAPALTLALNLQERPLNSLQLSPGSCVPISFPCSPVLKAVKLPSAAGVWEPHHLLLVPLAPPTLL